MKSQSKFKNQLTIAESAKLIELGVDPNLASGESLVGGALFKLADLLSILPKEIVATNVFGKRNSCPLIMEWWKRPKTWHVRYIGPSIPTNVGIAPELIDALNQLLIWSLTEKKINLNTDKK